jgi:predicted transcriptional regulator
MPNRTSFVVDDDVEVWVRLYARAYNTSVSRVINRAIRAFIRKLPEEERQFILKFEEEREFIEDDQPLAIPKPDEEDRE